MFNATIGVTFFAVVYTYSYIYIYTHTYIHIFQHVQGTALASAEQPPVAAPVGWEVWAPDGPARWWGSSVLQTIKLGICLGMVCYGLSCISHNMIGQ